MISVLHLGKDLLVGHNLRSLTITHNIICVPANACGVSVVQDWSGTPHALQASKGTPYWVKGTLSFEEATGSKASLSSQVPQRT